MWYKRFSQKWGKKWSNLVRLFTFFQPPTQKKLKLGLQIGRWEITNSKALGPIIMIGQSETRSTSQSVSQIIFITVFSLAGLRISCAFHELAVNQIIFITLFSLSQVLGFSVCLSFTSLGYAKTMQKCWAKTILLIQTHSPVLTCLHPTSIAKI